VTGYLATRCQLTFEASAIKRAIDKKGLVDFPFTDLDLDQALVFVEGLGWCERNPSDVGATVYWRATSKGVLEAERKGWNV